MNGHGSEPVELLRDCPVVLIPSGRRAILGAGERVRVVQSLGTSYTVEVERGLLVRIDGSDAGALGLEPAVSPAAGGAGVDATSGASGPDLDLEAVEDQLRTVFDPEIPVNVVDLGLVYTCEAVPLTGGGHRVEISMSMTAPGCGMGDILRDEARAKVLAVPGVREVDVELVWDPPWDLSRMSEAARLQLGLW
ncbi:MAG: putative Fe-S cluster assembly protein SufT [Acidimicrobiales bacterium]